MSVRTARDAQLLFSKLRFSDSLRDRTAAMRNEVESLEVDRIMTIPEADLQAYFVEKYSFDIPTLLKDKISASESETQVDVSNDRSRAIRDLSRPFFVPGQRMEIEIPFVGPPDLFGAQANTSTSAPPRAQIRGSSLFLVYEIPHDASVDIKPQMDRSISEIEQHLNWLRSDAGPHLNSIGAEALKMISSRKERLQKNHGRLASLGVPIKPRPGSELTYEVPAVRKKILPALPQVPAGFEAEPAISNEVYEHILKVIQNMALVMERSPSAFKTMGEEDLRQHFLVQLNGHFEGAATGETFNASGKTDILIREREKNVFIAECKFWSGPKNFNETIDQLLSYTSWRDTKTAILVFNRDTSMSTVIDGVHAGIKAHSCFKREVAWKHESGIKVCLHQPSDKNRELTCTVLVFNIPK